MAASFAPTNSSFAGARTAATPACERAPLIHASAVIAWSSYAAGLLLAVKLSPGTLPDLVAVGPRAIMLACGFACFMVVISMIQQHMGTALSASQTITPPRLCTSGIFRYSRNPIYLAFILPLAVLAVYSPAASLLTIS